MEHNRQNIRSLLQKYLDNKCTTNELDELFAYIKKYPDDPIFEESIKIEADSAMNTLQEQLPFEISEAMLQSLRSRLQTEAPKQHAFKFNSRTLLQWAAVFLIGFVCAGYFYFIANGNETIEVHSRYGETKTITLPDQSIVVLNGNSSVSYRSRLNESDIREVHLKGEAFFKVVHTSRNQKFWVHSSNAAKIEVLGTEFIVNNRRNAMKVRLHTGKIRLDLQKKKNTPSSIVMVPGESIEVTPESEVVRKKGDATISWTNNKFIFHDTPLQDILFLLEDSYGIVSVVNDNTLLQETFTATYPADVNVLLKALSRSFDMKVEESGAKKKIILGHNIQ